MCIGQASIWSELNEEASFAQWVHGAFSAESHKILLVYPKCETNNLRHGSSEFEI